MAETFTERLDGFAKDFGYSDEERQRLAHTVAHTSCSAEVALELLEQHEAIRAEQDFDRVFDPNQGVLFSQRNRIE